MNRITSILALSFTCAPMLSLAAPLAPEPDKGFVTEVHKTQAGTIVFAKTAAAVTTPEKPDLFTTKFKSGEPIFFRAYLPSSLNNAFRAQGVRCANPSRTWHLSVDGKPVTASNVDFFYSEQLDPNGFKASTSVRFDKALNAPGDSDKAIWNAFNALVAPTLTPGEHKIELGVRGLCADLERQQATASLDKDLAAGSFQLTVAKDAPIASVLPKPARNDAKLAKEAAEVIAREWKGDSVLKVVFVEPDWTKRYEDRGLRKVLVRRTIAAAVAVKQPRGCRVFDVTFEQLAQSESQFGPTARGGTGGNREVACDAIK